MKKLKKIFGTDGIRGDVGNAPMTAEIMLQLGSAVGAMLANTSNNHKVLIGKDTRISGYMIESALQAGLSSAGTNVYLLGPMPTPGIAYLTKAFRAELSIVISASHNAFTENGIKFFSSEGYKISSETENLIADWLNKPIKTLNAKQLGRAWRIDDASGRYIEFCKSSIPHHAHLKNLKIIVDCANGATYQIAPHVFAELGADVTQIHCWPDGLNINKQCGSTFPEIIRRYVLMNKADVGIAFDGDGDRVIMVDHTGDILDGDELLYIITKDLVTFNDIKGVVGTQMSNKGLELAINHLGAQFERVAVGDQNVINCLLNKHWMIGGEPSGHVINLNATTTADGIITALQILHIMQKTGKKLHDLKKELTMFPQTLINIPHNQKRIDLEAPNVKTLLNEAYHQLGAEGRILLRYSGTEPVIRVMVEGKEEKKVKEVAQYLANSINNLINLTQKIVF